ncbi:MAG: hypothetical protein WA102_14330 [Candidatus Methanoperedens sp.]
MSTKTDGGLIKRARFIAIIIVFSTIILSVAVPAARAAEQILVATNKYVILDDPIIKGLNGTGFADPKYSYSAWNYWNGIGKNTSTEINATALYLDNNGTPVQGINITFRLYYPNGSINTTRYGITNSMGLADVSIDLNNASFYGKWNLSATNGSQSANTTFIYNWWGCAYNAGYCSRNHNTNTPTGSAPVNSPYLSGRDTIVTRNAAHYNASATNCTYCHQSYDGNPGDTNPPVAGLADANHLNRTADVHRNVVGGCANSSCHNDLTLHRTNALIASCFNATGGCHVSRADLTSKNTLSNSVNVSNATSLYSINSTSFNATFHTPNSTVPCIICHGPMHNITKPDETQQFIRNNNTEDSQCKTCHTSYNEHNSSNITSGGVNCTICHSDDVHEIQVFAQNATYVDLNHDNPNPARGNCTNCHQNASFFAALESRPKAGNYTGRDPPQIPVPLNHSTDPYSGALWNGTPLRFWDNTSQVSACYYCHGNTTHNTSALGRIGNVKGINNLNQSLTSSTWCANCHYKNAPDYAGTSFLPEPPEILNASGKVPAKSRDGTTFTNHSNYFASGYNDSVCKNCHNNNLAASATSLNFSHNVNIGSGGAPNCIQCHNLVTGLSGGAPVGVNFTAVNLSVHYGINSQNATNWSYVAVIGACWACHDTDGNVSSGHPDKYKTPKTCTDCHLANGTYYNQSVKWGLNVTVSEHYYGGDQITAGNSSSGISSCINCHENVSEMIVYNNDTNLGSFTGDGVRLTGGNMSFYHYGRDRSDIRTGTTANCSYCHQNTNTAFNISMSDPAYSKNVSNHSMSYSSSNPGCSQCHNSGWLHNSTLTKPNITLPNSTYCLTCHGTGGTANIKNLSQHNGTVNCTQCHLNSTRSIHPVRYLQQDGTNFSAQKTGAVNCATCHQSGLGNFSSATKIPASMHHSDNANNGSVWGSYWTTPQTACIYCHSDTKHNSTPVGRILQWEQDYRLFGSINTNTTCASCHYRGDSNYTQMNSSFASAGLATPPEITNDTNWMGTSANYYNHSLDSYADQNCKTCHGSLLSAQTNMSEFMHTIATGVAGGADCVSCHNISGNGAPGDRRINASSLKLSAHKNINANAINTSVLDPINKACWACHGNGTQPDKHPVNYLYPKPCEYCHVNNNFNATPVYQHYPGSVFSGSIVYDNFDPNRTCVSCHNNSLVANQNITYGGYAAEKLKNASVSHYVVNRTFGESMPSAVTGILPDTRATTGTNFGCNKCHNTGAVGKDYGNARILPSSHNKMGSTGISCQSSCHNSNPQVNLTLHDKNTGIYVGSNGCFSSGCHIQPSTGGRRKR